MDALKTGSALWKKYSVVGGENLNGIPASRQRTTLQTKPENSSWQIAKIKNKTEQQKQHKGNKFKTKK